MVSPGDQGDLVSQGGKVTEEILLAYRDLQVLPAHLDFQEELLA